MFQVNTMRKNRLIAPLAFLMAVVLTACGG
ncbi:MAG: hypothetical protein RLZZ200_2300, partial [Pseudomonadota bacterium]